MHIVCFLSFIHFSLISSSLFFIVNIDDCWQVSRDADGTIQADPQAFPSGIPALVDYVHSKNLKFGLYSGTTITSLCLVSSIYAFSLQMLDAGFRTCQGRPGSLHHEIKDADTYAAWKVDYLKYDNCNTDGTTPEVRYSPMRDALNATGRPIFFSMCGK